MMISEISENLPDHNLAITHDDNLGFNSWKHEPTAMEGKNQKKLEELETMLMLQ